MIRRQRVGTLTVKIETGRGNDVVGIGDRWSAEVDGKVAMIVGTPYGLLIGTTKHVVSRLETVTGRQCARHQCDAPIVAIIADGTRVTIRTRDGDTVLLLRSLKLPKR